ncbi:MAG: nucleoside hydrolase, partial [Muribaculaceae bacterium]|nr:nucleoside hydrolase [Muribaculaceae bacterium]
MIAIKMKCRVLSVITAGLMACGIWASKPVNVIVETDMGNDIDDALAMDMAYKAMDDGLINIIAIGAHKLSSTAVDYIDVLNTWYGYGSIPIARSLTPVYNQHQNDYTLPVCAMRDAKGRALWKRSKTGGDIQDPVSLYRRLLAAQPDTSVVFLSLGFGTELAKLLESAPDDISPMSGMELVKRKVKYLSIMAGSYGFKQRAEYNVVNDIPAMKTVFEQWPTPIVQNPFEIGPKVMYRGDKLDEQFSWTSVHPVIDGFKRYMKMPYNRPTWDLLSVVYITNPEMFTRSEPGFVQVNKEGYTIFTPDPEGNVVWLSATPEQVKALDEHIVKTT